MVVPPQDQTTKKLTPKPIRKDRENTSSPLQIEKTPNKIRTNKNAIGMADRMNERSDLEQRHKFRISMALPECDSELPRSLDESHLF